MILFYAILFILFEAISEALIKRWRPDSFIFDNVTQWIIAVSLFIIWFIIMYHLYFIPVAKLIMGFVFVRFMIFDVVYNLTRGNPILYYGTEKWYDRTMAKLGSWGWFMKFVCGIIGIEFLTQWWEKFLEFIK